MPPAVTAVRGPLLGAGAALAVPVSRQGNRPRVGAGADALKSLRVDATEFLRGEKATGKPGEVVSIPLRRDGVDVVLLAGVGDGSPAELRKAAAAVARRAKGCRTLATTLAVDREPAAIRAIAEAIALASYRFSLSNGDGPKLRRVKLVVDNPTEARRALSRAASVADAVYLARDLANTPSLEKSPAWMADRAKTVAEAGGLKIRIWTEKQLAEQGFGGIVAVGQGSARPPRLVELTWDPAGAQRHVVLVGKGITFDSGGLSIKPNDSMVGMKTDMAGGAAVIGAMSALARLDVSVKVTGLVPLAENMPGGAALRPGDVITHYGGITSEVLNTDAEGRLVLADALAYAVANLAPDVVVDIATLTGAASLGLGKRHGALFTTTDELRDELVAASTAGGERLWPMPLEDDYRDALESRIADLRNIGSPAKSYSGGAIAAALFLREFVGRTPWAHLDVAGPARADGDEGEVSKGATGFGVRTFLRWLEALSA